MAKEKEKSRENVRGLVLDALLSIEKQENYSHIVIAGLLEKYNYLEGREKAFLKRLAEGTLERQIQLDYCINAFSKVPVKKMKPLIRILLRMSVYQLLFMDSVPDSAAINEAVKLAQSRSFGSLKGFVNGVLRNISRKKEEIVWPDVQTDRVNALSIRYSMPCWLIEKWDRELGRQKTEQVLQGLLEERPVTVRLRSTLTEQEQVEVKRELLEGGIQSRESSLLPCALVLGHTEGLKNIPAFAAGKFTVQDISSMLAVEAAGIHPGDFVIDTCAAPGGKMLFAAEKAGSGSVLARDISETKLLRMEENRLRMQADNIKLELWDAAVPDPAYTGRADVVLADVPCSGLGVIGRKRDIKYRVTPESLVQLPALQRQILETVWHYVKPGGVLLYSTCTISRAENEEMAEWFLQSHPFHAESMSAFLPEGLTGETMEQGYFQLLPGIHGTDGFFMARWIRDAE